MSTALEFLEKTRIFSVKKTPQDTFMFTEQCDQHYRAELNKGAVEKLIQELQALIK